MGANSSVPANYDAPAYTIIALEIVLTTAVVLGRIVSRRIMKVAPAADDYLAYAAYSVNLALLICGLLLTSSGALNLDEVSHQTNDERRFTRSTYNGLAALYVFAITLIKCSILFMYRRTFTMLTTWFRYAWFITLTLTFLWTITCVLLLALQAADKLPKNGFSRLGISVTGIINAFTDFLILGLPAFMISKMRLQRKQKIAVISIFLVGGVASIVSIVRGTIFFINRAYNLNEAYSNYLDVVLTATEASAGLMCACFPLMKPLLIRATLWIQKQRGRETKHHGWSTMSASVSKDVPPKLRTITRMDDWDVQLLPLTPTEERLAAGVGTPQVYNEQPAKPETQSWGSETPWGHNRI